MHEELQQAFKEGKAIQFYSVDNATWNDCLKPVWSPNTKYRLKETAKDPIYPSIAFLHEWDYHNSSPTNVLKQFVKSGALAKYVAEHGTDGMKTYD